MKLSLVDYLRGKGKAHPRIDHGAPEGEYRSSCTLSLTSVLDGVGGQHHAPANLPPERSLGTHYVGRRLRGSRSRSGRVRKISPTPEF